MLSRFLTPLVRGSSVAAAGVFLVGPALSQGVAVAPSGARAPVERVAVVPSGVPSNAGARPILDATGNVIATRRPGPEGRTLTVLSTDGTRFSAPAFQRWYGCSDGRSLLGVGDPQAPEHPFELRFALFRDGALVRESDGALDPESWFSVAADGRLAIVGHPVGERGRWAARVLESGGEELFRAELPAGRQAAGLALFDDHLLVLTHEPFLGTAGSLRRGQLLRVDALGRRDLASFEGVAGGLSAGGVASETRRTA